MNVVAALGEAVGERDGVALATGVTHAFFAGAAPLARLAAGAVVLAVVYWLFMLRRRSRQ